MKGNLYQAVASGRLGEVVGRVVHGVQIYAKYQPNVTNPKSIKQVIQRNYFTLATIAVRRFLTYGISNTQVIGVGASKNWNVSILRNSIIAQRCKANASYLVSGIKAIANTVIDDNSFNFTFDTLNTKLLTEEGSSPENVYFGSNSKINGNAIIFIQIAPKTEENTALYISNVDTVLSEDAVTLGAEKRRGFHTTAAGCGSWNYVYKITTSSLTPGVVGAGVNSIGLENPIKFNHIIMADVTRNVIGYFFSGVSFD